MMKTRLELAREELEKFKLESAAVLREEAEVVAKAQARLDALTESFGYIRETRERFIKALEARADNG